jgi:hypothetical protein
MLKIEEWRDIKGFEGIYQISTLGRVRSYERVINKHVYPSKIMSPVVRYTKNKKPCGQCVQVRDINRDNKQIGINVAKTVLETFIGDPIGKAKQVKHKNGNALDNRLENLEWDCSKAFFAPINEKARRLFHEKAQGIVKGICIKCYDIYNPWLYGMYDTDDLIQDCLLAIWETIDIYDETHCTFYSFCRIKVDFVFKSIYGKWKRRNKICSFSLCDDMEAAENEKIRKELGICNKRIRKD